VDKFHVLPQGQLVLEGLVAPLAGVGGVVLLVDLQLVISVNEVDKRIRLG
jgi:hypothetical protein